MFSCSRSLVLLSHNPHLPQALFLCTFPTIYIHPNPRRPEVVGQGQGHATDSLYTEEVSDQARMPMQDIALLERIST